jgi:hypothetical protein
MTDTQPTTSEVWYAFQDLRDGNRVPHERECDCISCKPWRTLERGLIRGLRRLDRGVLVVQPPKNLILDLEDAKALLNGLLDALRDLHLDDDVDDVSFTATQHTLSPTGELMVPGALHVEVHR